MPAPSKAIRGGTMRAKYEIKSRLRLTKERSRLGFLPLFLCSGHSWKMVQRFSRNLVRSREWSRTRPTSTHSGPVSSRVLKNPRILFSRENITSFCPLERGFSKDSDVDISSSLVSFIPKQYSSNMVYMLSLGSISASFTGKQLTTHLYKVRLPLALNTC